MRNASHRGACALAIFVSAAACTGATNGSDPPAQPPPVASHAHSAHAHGDHAHGDHAHGAHAHGAHAHGDHAHGDHAHGDQAHGHGQGPLVHSFTDAEKWAKELDKPERDAWQKPADVVALLALSPGMKVADIGAGTGYFEPYLSRAVGPTGVVHALDVEDDMVKYLGERAKRESLANVTARKVAFDDPGLAAASVDRVLIVDTWHHIAGREAYAKKLAAGLAPGGFVAIVDFTMEATHGPPKEHRVLADQVKRELEAGGLTAELATETLPDQYVVLGKKPAK